MTEYQQVSIAYVGTQEQVLCPLEIRAGATVQDAIAQSGIQARCPEIDLTINKVGIFGKVVSLDHRLVDGDRVEIYRPLIADPKEARRRRAVDQNPATSRSI